MEKIMVALVVMITTMFTTTPLCLRIDAASSPDLEPISKIEAKSHKKARAGAYFVFGDSLLDAGENNYLGPSSPKANFPPYGETHFHKPTGRWTNGRNIGDFIAHQLGLPYAPPYSQPGASFRKGVNFASAGSGLLDTTSPNTTNPMSLQLAQFKNATAILKLELGAHAAHHVMTKAFYLIQSGSNDLTRYLQSPDLQKQYTPNQYIALIVEAQQRILSTLYQAGARKVVVFGIPPMGCTPFARFSNSAQPGQCLSVGNEFAVETNVGYKSVVDAVRSKLPGFHAVYTETLSPAMAIINNGPAHGLKNVSAACCGAGPLQAEVRCGLPLPAHLTLSVCDRPDEYFFWDTRHPTEIGHRMLFELFWDGNSSISYPINGRTLSRLGRTV